MKYEKTFDQLCLETIEILNFIKHTITNNTDVAWTRVDTTEELIIALDKYMERVNEKDITVFSDLQSAFAPTALFQELSISNEWGKAFLDIAARYDTIYTQLISF